MEERTTSLNYGQNGDGGFDFCRVTNKTESVTTKTTSIDGSGNLTTIGTLTCVGVVNTGNTAITGSLTCDGLTSSSASTFNGITNNGSLTQNSSATFGGGITVNTNAITNNSTLNQVGLATFTTGISNNGYLTNSRAINGVLYYTLKGSSNYSGINIIYSYLKYDGTQGFNLSESFTLPTNYGQQITIAQNYNAADGLFGYSRYVFIKKYDGCFGNYMDNQFGYSNYLGTISITSTQLTITFKVPTPTSSSINWSYNISIL